MEGNSKWQCATCGEVKTTDDMSSQEPTECQECNDERNEEENNQ